MRIGRMVMKRVNLGIVCIIILLLFGCGEDEDGPAIGAQEWVDAVTNQDGNKMLKYTCLAQRESFQEAFMYLSAFSALAKAFTLGGVDVNFEGDISDLKFETISQSGDEAQVRVSGELRVSLTQGVAEAHQVDDEWQMVKENDTWRWCGSNTSTLLLADQLGGMAQPSQEQTANQLTPTPEATATSTVQAAPQARVGQEELSPGEFPDITLVKQKIKEEEEALKGCASSIPIGVIGQHIKMGYLCPNTEEHTTAVTFRPYANGIIMTRQDQPDRIYVLLNAPEDLGASGGLLKIISNVDASQASDIKQVEKDYSDRLGEPVQGDINPIDEIVQDFQNKIVIGGAGGLTSVLVFDRTGEGVWAYIYLGRAEIGEQSAILSFPISVSLLGIIFPEVLANENEIEEGITFYVYKRGFSPDGKQVVVTGPKGDLILMHTEDGQTQLTSDKASNLDPKISPLGTHIIFSSTRSGQRELYVMNTDGSNVQQLSEISASRNIEASWVPDGKSVVYTIPGVNTTTLRHEISFVSVDLNGENENYFI